MHNHDTVTAAIVIIGDEILSGRTADRNVNYIAKHLAVIGITLREVRIIPDCEKEIIAAINHLRALYDYLFTTGGIGPTHDDITADSIAKAFGVDIDIDPRAVDMMRLRYREEDLVGDRLRMARIPAGATLIENPISNTPGFMLDNVIVMAGIPNIMQVMLDAVSPRLRRGAPIISRTVRVIAPESQIAASLREIQNLYDRVSLGSYPFIEDGILGANLVARSTDQKYLLTAEQALIERLQKEGIPCERIPSEK